MHNTLAERHSLYYAEPFESSRGSSIFEAINASTKQTPMMGDALTAFYSASETGLSLASQLYHCAITNVVAPVAGSTTTALVPQRLCAALTSFERYFALADGRLIDVCHFAVDCLY